MSNHSDEIRMMEIAKDIAIETVKLKNFHSDNNRTPQSEVILEVFKKALKVVREEAVAK